MKIIGIKFRSAHGNFAISREGKPPSLKSEKELRTNGGIVGDKTEHLINSLKANPGKEIPLELNL